MIPHHAKPGRSFRRPLTYVFREDRLPELVGGNMAGEEPSSLTAEFEAIHGMRDDIDKPVFSVSLSLTRGERLSSHTWHQLSEDYLHGLGYENSAWVSIRHRNTDLDHAHLLASRIDYTGRWVNAAFERVRAFRVIDDICRRYDLVQVATRRPGTSLSRGDLAQFEDTCQVNANDRLAEHIRWAGRGAPGFGEFVDRLTAQGVGIHIHRQPDGQPRGVSFHWEGIDCRGGSLGRRMTWNGLQLSLGLRYEAARDEPAFRRAQERPLSRRLAAPLDVPVSPVATNTSLATRYSNRVTEIVRAELAARTAEAMRQHGRIVNLIARTREDCNRHLALRSEIEDRSLRLEQALPRILAAKSPDLERLQEWIRRGNFDEARRRLDRDFAKSGHRPSVVTRRPSDSRVAVLAVGRELDELAGLGARLAATAPQLARLERRLERAEAIERIRRRTASLLPPLQRSVNAFDVAAQRLAQDLAPLVARGAVAPVRWAMRLAARDDEASRGR
jgi:hypothetical protein